MLVVYHTSNASYTERTAHTLNILNYLTKTCCCGRRHLHARRWHCGLYKGQSQTASMFNRRILSPAFTEIAAVYESMQVLMPAFEEVALVMNM